MNQDPPILIPYVDKEVNNTMTTTFNQESITNGYLINGNKSPPMPILYEADREPPPLFNMADIFSALTKEEFNENEFSLNIEPRIESASLFEKIYKDYCSTLSTTNQITEINKNLKNFQLEKINNNNISKESHEKINNNNDDDDDDEVSIETKKNKENNSITAENQIKNIQKRQKRKRKIKRINKHFNDDDDDDDDDEKEKEIKQKFGIKTQINKKRKECKTLEIRQSIINKDINDNKYLKSPFIALRHRTNLKKIITPTNVISASYEIVNPALRGTSDYNSSTYRPNLKSLSNNQFSSMTTCVCSLCGQSSSFLNMGFLYGPYYIDRDFVHTLPLTCIFPSEANEIGVSGKSAIKSDKNGNVKMVIQSSKYSRNNTSKKISNIVEDYRVTWDGEVWFHRECVLWAPGTYLRGDGKIGGLDEALKMALNAECFVCHKIGAILNCTTKNCEKNFHYYCAFIQDCKLNDEQLSVLCSKHREK